MANKKRYLGILAAAIVLSTLFISCEINIGNFNDRDLILRSGYAWVTDDLDIDFDIFDHGIGIDIDYVEYGLIFKRNGTVYFIEKHDGDWEQVDSALYSTSGRHVYIDGKSWNYDIDDDELEIGGDDFEEEYVGTVDLD
jgi:hypothetical protein